jgi:hypothetical protein
MELKADDQFSDNNAMALIDKGDQTLGFFLVLKINHQMTDQCCFFYPDTHQEYRYHCNNNNEQAVPVI